jgi:hypothetical protein
LKEKYFRDAGLMGTPVHSQKYYVDVHTSLANEEKVLVTDSVNFWISCFCFQIGKRQSVYRGILQMAQRTCNCLFCQIAS